MNIWLGVPYIRSNHNILCYLKYDWEILWTSYNEFMGRGTLSQKQSWHFEFDFGREDTSTLKINGKIVSTFPNNGTNTLRLILRLSYDVLRMPATVDEVKKSSVENASGLKSKAVSAAAAAAAAATAPFKIFFFFKF